MMVSHRPVDGWNMPDVLPFFRETAASTASKKRRGGSLYHWPLALELSEKGHGNIAPDFRSALRNQGKSHCFYAHAAIWFSAIYYLYTCNVIPCSAQVQIIF